MDLNEQQLLRTIVREEMKSALKEIGLHDDDAGDDVRSSRSDKLKDSDWTQVADAPVDKAA